MKYRENQIQKREQRQEAHREHIRRQIEHMGLRLTTSPAGLHRITGKGLNIMVKDLALVTDADLIPWSKAL